MTPEERLERRLERKAARENERRTEAAPLLASGGLVQLVGVEEMRQRRARSKQIAATIRDQQAEMDRRSHEEAAALREKVAAWVSPDVLAACDANVKRQFTHPSSPMGAYVKWFWAERLRLLSAGQPALPPVYFYSPEEQAASIAKMSALKRLWECIAAERHDLMARIRLFDRPAMREMQALREAAEVAAGLPPRTREERPASVADDQPQLGLFDKVECRR